MTQTLPISTLMLTADSALKADSSPASGFIAGSQLSQNDADMKEQGSGFSALLNGMVLPANGGKTGLSARQNAAAASGLSAISAAMLQATAQDADSADADDTALANSLLLQIALKNNNNDAEQVSDDSEAGASTDDAVADDTAESADSTLAGQPQAALAAELDDMATPANDSQKNQAMSDDSVSTADSNKTEKNSAVMADVAVADDTAQSSKAAQPAKLAADAAPQASVTMSGSDAAKPQAVQPVTQDQTPEQLAMVAGADAEPLTEQLAVVQTAVQQRDTGHGDSAVNSAASSNTEAKTAAGAETAADNIAIRPTTAQQNAEPAAVSAQAKLVVNSKANDSNQAASTDTDKANTIKTESASMLKNATADQGAQQQGQPHSERPFTTFEQPATAKSAADTGATRTENSFTASLHAADSRQQTQSSKTVAKTATEQLKQALNLQQHDTAGQLRERVNLMVRQNIQIAEIRLDPVGLGQMQIKIDMQQEQANVQFIVQQPQAKELLEQQLPRLREMLQQQGIVLGEGSVQQQSQQERQLAERQQQQQGGQGRQHGEAESGASDDSMQTQLKVAPTDRLVDYYA